MAVLDTLSSAKSKITRFLREVKSEFKKVAWPDRKALSGYTGVVFVSVIFAALIIWAVDTGYTNLLKIFMR